MSNISIGESLPVALRVLCLSCIGLGLFSISMVFRFCTGMLLVWGLVIMSFEVILPAGLLIKDIRNVICNWRSFIFCSWFWVGAG